MKTALALSAGIMLALGVATGCKKKQEQPAPPAAPAGVQEMKESAEQAAEETKEGAKEAAEEIEEGGREAEKAPAVTKENAAEELDKLRKEIDEDK